MLKRRLKSASLALLVAGLLYATICHERLRQFLTGDSRDTERRLASHLNKVEFDNVPFRKALGRFAQSTGLTFDVDWQALDAAGVPSRRVRLRLENVTVATALDELINAGFVMAGEHANDVSPDGRILIASGPELDRCTVTRLYDLRDLVDGDLRYQLRIPAGQSVDDAILTAQAPPYAAAPTFGMQLGPSTRPSSSLFGNGPNSGASTVVPAADLMVEYQELVIGELERGIWDGPDYSRRVRVMGRFLSVTDRPAVQAEVAALLEKFRQASGPVPLIDVEQAHAQAGKEPTLGEPRLVGH